MAGHTSRDEVKAGAAVSVAASQTNTQVSEVFRMTHEDSLWGVVDVVTSAQTVATGITAKVQDSFDNATWYDKKTVAITGGTPGTWTIKWLSEAAGDQTYLPMRSLCRVVVTTGAGDSVTVSAVRRSFRG